MSYPNPGPLFRDSADFDLGGGKIMFTKPQAVNDNEVDD